jgi:hypothetical protein
MDQRISGSAVDGAPTEEPRPDASNARSQRPATRHKGNWQLACPVLCSCLCVETPVVALRCFTLPRSSILCGCINFPGKKGNAVWGRYPTACTVYVKKNTLECIGWGLVDKIYPAFELRNSGVQPESWSCLVTGLRVGRQVGPAVKPEAPTGMPARGVCIQYHHVCDPVPELRIQFRNRGFETIPDDLSKPVAAFVARASWVPSGPSLPDLGPVLVPPGSWVLLPAG